MSGFEIPSRFFQFLRTGNPAPLEPVLEHNRLDLVSLAAVTGHALRLARSGDEACRDAAEALALGRVLERAQAFERAVACYRRAALSTCVEIRGEACYRLGLRDRRDRRFAEAATNWRQIVAITDSASHRRKEGMAALRQFAIEALAIHQEHRERDFDVGAGARAVCARRRRSFAVKGRRVASPVGEAGSEARENPERTPVLLDERVGRTALRDVTSRPAASSRRPSARPCGSRRSARQIAS